MFSGGLDSTVVARLASEVSQVTLYTMGVEGAHDILVSEGGSQQLGLPWEALVLREEEIISALPRLASIIGTDSPLTLSFEMPLWVGAARCKERLILTGQGADELFGGYARYQKMGPGQLMKNMEKDQDELLEVGVRREQAIAAHFGKDARYPFLHPKVIELARALSPDDCVRGETRKVVLRDVAQLLGLDEAAQRPKKAAQYGSGVMKVMKAEAKRRGIELRQLVSVLMQESETV
jgi:asparagine synthase (glutamine-hydrolysing)